MTTYNDELALGYAKLRLNIDLPNLEDCWLDGYESAEQQQSEEENPYTIGTKEHEFWAQGWWAGFYGEAPLFDYAGHVLPSISEKVEITTIINEQAAANVSFWQNPKTKLWMKRGLQLVCVVAAAVVALELAELAA